MNSPVFPRLSDSEGLIFFLSLLFLCTAGNAIPSIKIGKVFDGPKTVFLRCTLLPPFPRRNLARSSVLFDFISRPLSPDHKFLKHFLLGRNCHPALFLPRKKKVCRLLANNCWPLFRYANRTEEIKKTSAYLMHFTLLPSICSPGDICELIF